MNNVLPHCFCPGAVGKLADAVVLMESLSNATSATLCVVSFADTLVSAIEQVTAVSAALTRSVDDRLFPEPGAVVSRVTRFLHTAAHGMMF